MFNLLLSSPYLIDRIESPAKWLTISLVAVFAVLLVIALLVKRKSLTAFVKKLSVGLIFYALVLGIFLLALEIGKKFDVAYLEENWVSVDVIYLVLLPLLITLSLALIGGITLYLLSKVKPQAVKKAITAFGALLLIAVVATLILIGVHYSKNVSGDGYYSEEINPIALYITAVIIIVLTLSTALFLGRKDKKPFDTRCISLAGICVSLSFALSYVKLWDMPTGGSITLVSFLPIMLFSYIYGTKKGLLVGFLYGVLQAVQDPWLIHPAQFLLDYPIAFSMVCFAGALTDLRVLGKLPQVKFTISAIVCGALRFFCHVLSGVFAFGIYAKDLGFTNFWAYSLVYNLYVFIDVALVVLVGCILLSSKAFNRQIESLNPIE